MLDSKTLANILTDWWGNPIVVKGPLGPMASRTVEHLASLVSAAESEDSYVRVRLARGADGETDLRIELEGGKGDIQVFRWRPLEGNLDTDVGEGGRILRRTPESLKRQAIDLEFAKKDPSGMDLQAIRPAVTSLKVRRFELKDQLEALILTGADTSLVSAELADIEAKISAASIVNTELNVIRKAETLAKEAELAVLEAQLDVAPAPMPVEVAVDDGK